MRTFRTSRRASLRPNRWVAIVGPGRRGRRARVRTRAMRDVVVTTFLVFLATAFERADESILPACFKSIEADRGWSPSMLSQLVFARTMAQALASPFFGLAADFGAGRRGAMVALIGAGVLAWSAVTLALAEGVAGYRATPRVRAARRRAHVPARRERARGAAPPAAAGAGRVRPQFTASLSSLASVWRRTARRRRRAWRAVFRAFAAASWAVGCAVPRARGPRGARRRAAAVAHARAAPRSFGCRRSRASSCRARSARCRGCACRGSRCSTRRWAARPARERAVRVLLARHARRRDRRRRVRPARGARPRPRPHRRGDFQRAPAVGMHVVLRLPRSSRRGSGASAALFVGRALLRSAASTRALLRHRAALRSTVYADRAPR